MTATQSNINMCKTLLSMVLLDYSNANIIGWGDQDQQQGLLGGGSHYAKINRSLQYINDERRQKLPGFEDDLFLMIDAYDGWFQLPESVLLSRFRDILHEESARVAQRMGRAYYKEGIQPLVVFGGGKRCAPNQLQTIACYPVPESPLPFDLRSGHTDTVLGRNEFSSFRTRYLNAGFMMGKVRHVRPLLERAHEKLNECMDRTEAAFDGGWGTSDNCYHGSDQSIFNEMFGEQEFYREVMRRHNRASYDDFMDKLVSNRAGSTPPPTQIAGIPVQDFLNPGFPHQQYNTTYSPKKPFEFGIAIDYWSSLSHQTSNAIADGRYIRHSEPLEPQIGEQGPWDCSPTAPMAIDLDETTEDLLGDEELNQWDTIPLYTEICVGTVPVIVHQNSVFKDQLEIQWNETWWHGRARKLLERRRAEQSPMLNGLPTDAGDLLSWEQLCPVHVEAELFRDVVPDQQPPEAGEPLAEPISGELEPALESEPDSLPEPLPETLDALPETLPEIPENDVPGPPPQEPVPQPMTELPDTVQEPPLGGPPEFASEPLDSFSSIKPEHVTDVPPENIHANQLPALTSDLHVESLSEPASDPDLVPPDTDATSSEFTEPEPKSDSK